MILAGDIGGTKCNLAAFAQRGGTIELVFQNRYATREFSSFEQVVDAFRYEAAQQGAMQPDRLDVAAQRLGKILSDAGGWTEREIRKIESFDISNIQGTDSVAGMVVLDRGKFDKNQYRVFNIKYASLGADDFRSMAEAVDRRYRRVLGDEKAIARSRAHRRRTRPAQRGTRRR